MKAITLWPEWAWAITRLHKNVENRTYKPPRSIEIGTELAIHAGATWGGSGKYQRLDNVFAPVAMMARRAGWRTGVNMAEGTIQAYSVNNPAAFNDRVGNISSGGVVAVVKFGGVLVPGVADPREWPWWAVNQFGYILNNVAVLETPVPCRGQQRIWNLKGAVLAEVVKQIKEF